MTASLSQWWLGRSRRERNLLLLMLAIAVPILLWLLVVRPLDTAFTTARLSLNESIARHGRIIAKADALMAAPVPDAPKGKPLDTLASLSVLVADAASQIGLTLDSANPVGSNAIDIRIAQARPAAVTGMLSHLETRGLSVESMRMTPAGTGTVSVSARLVRR
ncbi:hypothetical protein GCM10023219_15570 [Stakelama sediminis]|uniref:General secretion pathway protein M n=1 Tax=Stakelama sediminis TaxID=463200 RepID=A0A840YXN2_9SPHN|nr:type II secretion system protein GspM [Stakelama sediminis]MBB5718286.1 general secretion pathway protein M [Stakelama sediminis]